MAVSPVRKARAISGVESRMAAGEEQPQAIVGDRAHVISLLDRQRLQLTQQQLLLLAQGRLATNAVDCPVAGGGRDPGARVVGYPLRRPALEGNDEGVLNRLLRQVEVAENPDQGRDRPPGLVPEQAVDDLRGSAYRRASASFLWTVEPAAS